MITIIILVVLLVKFSKQIFDTLELVSSRWDKYNEQAKQKLNK